MKVLQGGYTQHASEGSAISCGARAVASKVLWGQGSKGLLLYPDLLYGEADKLIDIWTRLALNNNDNNNRGQMAGTTNGANS